MIHTELNWYLIHTKPRAERRAEENLTRQGYKCFLPLFAAEKLHRGKRTVVFLPLFARYLFLQLSAQQDGHNWGPIRSTLGVSRIVSFGSEPAKLSDGLIEVLQKQTFALQDHPQALFEPHQQVIITKGPYNGLSAIYQMPDGERRAMVLIDFLHKQVPLKVDLTSLVALPN